MAFYIAEQGMNEVLANWSSSRYSAVPLWGTDSVAGAVPQGAYKVSIHHLTDRMYFLESEGRVTRGGRLAGAVRKLGVLARLLPSAINPESALTTRGQTRVGGTAVVNGNDSIPTGWSSQCDASTRRNRPGVMTDASGTVQKIGSGQIYGAPDTVRNHSIADSTFLKFGDQRWEDLVGLAQADGKDITSLGAVPGDPRPVAAAGVCLTSDKLNWGEPWRSASQGAGFRPECVDYFPLVYHQGPSVRLQGNGRGQGILLVGRVTYHPIGSVASMSGDVDLRGNFTFMGVIFALGNFSTQGAGPRVEGGVMAANADLSREDIIGGSRVQYSSCAIQNAVLGNSALSRARPLASRSWVDLSNLGR
jgi:hypothetical protein